ncbi:MAG TPA: hypothetical protein VF103_11665, partial [Polyangiaceae bacterium]
MVHLVSRSRCLFALVPLLCAACGLDVADAEDAGERVATTQEGLTTCGPSGSTTDNDGDGIADGCEQYIAE